MSKYEEIKKECEGLPTIVNTSKYAIERIIQAADEALAEKDEEIKRLKAAHTKGQRQ